MTVFIQPFKMIEIFFRIPCEGNDGLLVRRLIDDIHKLEAEEIIGEFVRSKEMLQFILITEEIQ